MRRTVTALEARKRLGELLESVYLRGDEVVIERAGKPMAVVIPADRYSAIERNREELFAMIEEIQERTRGIPPEVLQAEIDEAVREAREELRAADGR